MYVRERDHLQAMAVLNRAAASSTRDQFAANVMPGLRHLFRADEVSHSEVLTTTSRSTGRIGHTIGYPTPVTALPDALHVYRSRAAEHPWVAHVLRRGGMPSVRLSELCSAAELRRSAFYHDFFRPRGVNYCDYQAISVSRGRVIGFAVCRSRRDFTADEHDLFEHLRKPLGSIWRLVTRLEALDRPQPAPGRDLPEVKLTASERQVANLLTRGWRTEDIAAALGVSPKAVEQHLTHIYRKADVTCRAAYIARHIPRHE